MNVLWSMATTIGNPERIPSFLETAMEIDGKEWNHAAQKEIKSV